MEKKRIRNRGEMAKNVEKWQKICVPKVNLFSPGGSSTPMSPKKGSGAASSSSCRARKSGSSRAVEWEKNGGK